MNKRPIPLKDPKRGTRLLAPNGEGIENAADALISGRLVAFPTETVYGLGADATSDPAVALIYKAKGRPAFNPLIVHVENLKAAQKYAIFNAPAIRLAKKFWPGALTLVLPRREGCPLSSQVSAGLDTVAIRVPNHPIANDLLRVSSVPIAAPSANRSGEVSPTQAVHVLNAWPETDVPGPSLILDGGPCVVGLESTVIDLTSDQPTLLRPGGVTKEQLRDVVGGIAHADGTPNQPRSPGMLARHYSPALPVHLNAVTAKQGGALLGFGPDAQAATLNLSNTGDVQEAAANLFTMIRALDNKRFSSISISPIPVDGVGLAINDRLRRAATPEP